MRKRFGFLFQMGALFDSLTAGQNVAFPLMEHTQHSDEEIAGRRQEEAGAGRAGRRAEQAARGALGRAAQSVALARAIALDPEIILYDEPTTGLDPIRADSINDLIVKLKDELGVTSVVVTHDMTSAFKVADRILMLHQGQFIADGTADDIRNSTDVHVKRFVAGDADLDVDAVTA